MKPNTSLTGAASSNSTSAGSLVERHPRLQRIGGFTLIEQVVVIALISLLMGLVVTSINLIRDKANQVKCGSNLKNLYLVVQMYADQHGGLFPEVTDLSQVPLKVMEALEPYLKDKEIFCCPEDPNKPTLPGGSYDWRVTYDPKTTLSGVRLDLIRHPNRVIIAGERSAGWHESGMINVLYADGHVELVTEKEWFQNITTPIEKP